MVVALTLGLCVTFGGSTGPRLQHRPQPQNNRPQHGPQQWVGLDVTTAPAETPMSLHGFNGYRYIGHQHRP